MAELKNETIVDRVVSRLQSQPLGDLITEEDLHDIVKEAIPRTFFKDRHISSGQYGRDSVKPPLIIEIMEAALKESVKLLVADWLIENAEETAKFWRDVLDKNLVDYVREVQAQSAVELLRQSLSGVFQTMNQDRQNRGLSSLPLFF